MDINVELTVAGGTGAKARPLRIGLLVPSTNTTVETDFWRLAPRGVTIHTARMNVEGEVAGRPERMNLQAERAVKDLATAEVNIIAYACTVGSLWYGFGYDQELANRLSEVAGLPVITTSAALVEALKDLRIKKVSVCTPYTDDWNMLISPFLEQNGFEVLIVKGLQVADAHVCCELLPSTAYKMAKKVNRPEADGVFISCTAWRAFEIIGRLEKALGKPVVCSNQVTFWAVLRHLGITKPIKGYGKLLELIGSPPA